MIKIFIIGTLAFAFVSGCASTQTITASDRQSIKSISISPEIKKRDSMYYYGPGKWAADQFPVVGGIALAMSHKPIGEDLELQALTNNIHIDQIAREEVASALRNANRYKLEEDGSPGTDTLVIEINQYGFSVPNGGSSKLVPLVRITCSIIDANGRTLWKASDGLLPLFNPVKAERPEDLYNNPKLIENSWRDASKIIAAKIIKDL
jgi:hypothetical protein